MPVTKASLPSGRTKNSSAARSQDAHRSSDNIQKHLFDLTRLVDGQSVTVHRDFLLGGPDPVQHPPPAFHGEREIGACGRGAFLDAQN